MILGAGLALLLFSLPASAASPGSNQPAGWATLTDWSADSLAGSGFNDDEYKTCTFENGAAVATWKAGAAGGGCHLDSDRFFNQPLKEFYFAIRWKHDYCCSPNGYDKIFYFWSYPEGGMSNQAIMLHYKKLVMDMQDPGTNNCHIVGAWGDSYCSILPSSSPPVTLNEWHVIEMKVKTSTTKSSRDGTVEEWLDGTKVMDYRGVNVNPGGVYNFQWTQTWTYPGQGDSTVDWHQYLDHVYISVPGSGGDSSAPLAPRGLTLL